MPEVQEVFRMSTQKVKPDPGALDRQLTRQRRRNVGKKVGAFAVAAAIGVAAIALFVGTRDERTTRTPLANPADEEAVEVARGFLEAYGAFDADRAITYLAEDAFIDDFTWGGTLREFRLAISLLEAEGYRQIIDSCEVTGRFTSGTSVRCTFDFHLLRSDQIGRGPFDGSYFDLRVRDGKIFEASSYWEIARFSPQMWEPFAEWVSENHPEDAAVMYQDDTYSLEQLTVESIRLWDQHTRGYVDHVRRST